MATSGPRKAVITENNLPDITVFQDGVAGYVVRYRIISEDENRFSHYSPLYRVIPNYLYERPAGKSASNFVILRRGPYVDVQWDPVSVRDRVSNNFIKTQNKYDVWVRWTKGEENGIWIESEREEGPRRGFIIPSSYELDDGTVVSEEPTELSVEIYVRATNRSRSNTDLLVYALNDEDVSVPFPGSNV